MFGSMFRVAVQLLVALAASAVVVAGCGEEAEPGERTLSKREYIAEANDLQSDANEVFAALDGRLAATPAAAKVHLTAFDELIAGYEALRPPRDWRDEHDELLEALRTMRQSMLVVSRASARNRRAITAQVARYDAAQQRFVEAVRSINASR
jgi:hypothetical protein